MSGNSQISTNQAARYTITLGGGEISQADPKGLEYLCVEDHCDMIGVAEFTFAGGAGTEWGSLEIGADVEVKIGGDDRKLFVGFITGLRHSYQQGRDSLTVLAMDPLCKLAASRVVKVYEEMTDSDIASAVISDGGATAGTVDSTSGTHKYVFQRNESNLVFLRRLAARNGYLVMANEGNIDFKSAQFSGSSTELAKDQVISLDYTFSTRVLPPSITCYGWDYVRKEMVEGTASSGDIQAIGGGTNAVEKAGILWSGDSYISDVLVNSQEGAVEMAKAELNRLARNFLRGRAVVQGNGAVHAGTKVKFSGHQEKYNPEGYVISSRHRVFVKGGFTSEIVFCSNAFPDG